MVSVNSTRLLRLSRCERCARSTSVITALGGLAFYKPSVQL
jgi:hypothetical protein